MANQTVERGTIPDMRTTFLENFLPTQLEWFGFIAFDAVPAAVNLFLDSQKNHNLALPVKSHILMNVMLTAHNITDGTEISMIRQVGFERVVNGAISAITLTGAQAISVAPGSETLTFSTDDTTGEIKPLFKGAASKTYKVAMVATICGVSANSRNSTFLRQEG